ncbi:MAG: M28 family peptidase, partial [Candidatus Bathyarchaeum sp.]
YEDGERFADIALNTSYTYTTAPIQKISTTGVSDHVSFWDAGIPALCICESMFYQNPYYHQPTDSMDAEGYNFTLGAKAAQVVAATIAKLAGIRTLYEQLTFSFTFGEETYHITTSSNSSVTDFYFDPDDGTFIKFNVIGPNGTTGFCNVTIPEDLLRGEFSVYMDGFSLVEDEDYTQTYNGTNYIFYITYTHTTHVIEIRGTDVIPELASWAILSLLLLTTLVIVVNKKKLLNQTGKPQ